jgi:predicted amidohydrolase YtcJ
MTLGPLEDEGDTAMPADLLIVNGRIFRGFGPGEPPPHGSAPGPRPEGAPTAIALAGGRITFVGDDATARRDHAGPRSIVLDARGGLVSAGLEDAHLHLLSGARSLDRVDLFGAETLEEIGSRITRWAAEHPDASWVVGRGWFYVPFPGGLPTAAQLDALVPDRPAYLRCYDGHSGWANSRALAIAGVHATTPDPPNGRIVRDPATGEPTGAVLESAQELLERVLPSPTADEDAASLGRAFAALAEAGITAVQDAWVEAGDVPLFRRLRDAGAIPLRVRLGMGMPSGIEPGPWRDLLDRYEALVGGLAGDPWLTSGILKGFADGVIESRTAAMLAPYEGTDSTGDPEWAPEALAAAVEEASRRGWQLEIHAIGDAGVRMALDAYERSGAAGAGDPRARRHRVEHIETIDPADLPRFGKLGVIAGMQPFHADPAPGQIRIWAANIGPERASRAWAWRSILDGGGWLAFGSDWPVVPFDPFIALHGAVTRQTPAGEPPGGWLPSERLTVAEALAAYTHGSAFAAHAETRRGMIAVGGDADLVVLDRDLLAEDPSAIVESRAVATIVGGRVVHGEGAA